MKATPSAPTLPALTWAPEPDESPADPAAELGRPDPGQNRHGGTGGANPCLRETVEKGRSGHGRR